MSLHRILAMAAVLICWVGVGGHALALEGRRADFVGLAGSWEFVLGEGDEEAFRSEDAATLDWQPVTLPGNFLPYSQEAATGTRFVWARRRFDVSQAQARRMAVLRWNHIMHGATAYVNGNKVGHHDPTGPYQVILPESVLRPGENEIVLRIAGAAGVRKAASGHFLFPVGQIWGPSRPAMPAVDQDIWIDFADRAYMKWVLAIPDLKAGKVALRITPNGHEDLDNLTISASVRLWPDGEVVGKGAASARLVPHTDPLGGEHYFVDVPMSEVRTWTPEACHLYLAEVRLSAGEQLLDVAEVRFGMRELAVADGNYKLNGKNLWIRGSNLVHEWGWDDVFNGVEKEYLVTEARELNTNAFRTHTQPPPHDWTDICDEHGTMILSEFPLLYNYRDPKYTPEEWEVFHRNAMLDTAGWMARLWNHPSVIMWVLSNESRSDNEWEAGPFRNFVTEFDPTRPTMRTGTTGTKTNYDVHTCGNTNHWTHEGRMHLEVDEWFQKAHGRTVTNSEYMNIFDRPKCQWTGTDDDLADRLAYAQIGMEHTEVMRRARLDAILPYMYAKWSRVRRGDTWKAGYAWPISACWHSSLSPVLASLDLFDANYVVGQDVTTDLHLINDSWRDVRIHVDLLLTEECPEFIPEADCFERPLRTWSFDFELAADSIRKSPVAWELPEEAGDYWLTARLTGIEGRSVLSQRFVRAVARPEMPPVDERRNVVLLGGDEISDAYFREHGIAVSQDVRDLHEEDGVVIVWDPAKLTPDERHQANAICEFAASGGRVVVLSTPRWNWRELCDVEFDRTSGSRVFPYEDSEHWLLRGVDAECLKRWNGLPGTVAVGSLAGASVQHGKKILWVREPKHTVVAEVPVSSGEGVVLFSQLDLRRHVQSGHRYDPVAEGLLVNILSK